MDYEGRICRSPFERSAYMLPTSVGCSYNACTFCMLFKHLKYRELPISQIEDELLRIKSLNADPRRVFLGDGNAFGQDSSRLLAITGLLHKHFPNITAINMDATVTNISKKRDEELRLLKNEGIDQLYIGIESGLDDVLKFTKKGHTIAQAYEQLERAARFGFRYAAHIMTGIAGKGRGLENAEKTAELLNRTGPCSITNFSMFVHTRSPLFKDVMARRFMPADELECLIEAAKLVELLDIPVAFDSFHDMVNTRVRGQLPSDKAKILGEFDKAIETLKDKLSVLSIVNDDGIDIPDFLRG